MGKERKGRKGREKKQNLSGGKAERMRGGKNKEKVKPSRNSSASRGARTK